MDVCPHCGCDALDLAVMREERYVTCRICRMQGPRAEMRAEAARLWNSICME